MTSDSTSMGIEGHVDLLAILGTLRRHWWVTVLVTALTVIGAGAVVATSPPQWTATTSFLLIEPPTPPTVEDLEENPRLGRINSDNPFVRYGDPAVVIDVVSRIAATEAVHDEIEAAGGSPDFEVAPSARYGAASPIVDVSVTSDSEERVLSSLALVGDFVGQQLRSVQSQGDVDPTYFYTLRQIDTPTQASQEFSSTLRLLVGVLVLGLLTLLAVISILEGRRRSGRAAVEPGARLPREAPSAVGREAASGSGSAAGPQDARTGVDPRDDASTSASNPASDAAVR